jgi:alkanesulfonate monooxygenase SsuD/methylene tetrahydromethanopterin reductase-like flavin-dependent oxidoreductase (luciferase family)
MPGADIDRPAETMRLSAMMSMAVPYQDIVPHARLAEDLGFDTLVCSHIAGRDSFATLAALATITERIGLASAVAPIYPRSPASMAQAAATVDDISAGRFRLGLGIGHRVTMRDWHGQDIGRPTVEMREYITLVRAMLAGTPPPAGERWATSFVFVGFRPRADIPIWQAALSPAMLRLAGEIADGVVLWACPPQYVRDVVVPHVTAGRSTAGKPIETFQIVASMPAAVGGDRQRVMDGVREELHRYLGLPFYRTMFTAAGFADDLAAYDDAAPDRSAQKAAISRRLIDSLCAVGGEEDIAAGVDRYQRAGATNLILTPVLGADFGPTLRAAALPR